MAGRTAVSIALDVPLPLFEYSRSVCRFGALTVSAALTVAHGAAARASRRIDGAAAAAAAAAGGGAGGGGLVCLAPAHEVADVQVTVSLNGQQFTRSDAALYSSLPSAGVAGGAWFANGGAAAELLRGLRYRFYATPQLSSLAPQHGPSTGGTLLRLLGAGMLGNVLHGGARQARCLLSRRGPPSGTRELAAARDLSLAATLVSDGEMRCVAPKAAVGSYSVRVSLNGGANWHHNASHGSSFAALAASAGSVVAGGARGLVYAATCDAAAPRASCLRDPACGWCYDDALAPRQCLPCAADPLGAPACALGPALAAGPCRDWTHAAPQPLLSSVGGGRAAVLSEARAGRMAYFVLRPPHAHALLRVGFQPLNNVRATARARARCRAHTAATSRPPAPAPAPPTLDLPPPTARLRLCQTNAKLFAKRGAPPEADDFDATALQGEVLSLHATLAPAPMPTGRDTGTCLAGCGSGVDGGIDGASGRGDGRDGGGGAARGDDAWYIGVQGLDFFYEDRFLYEENPSNLGGEPFYTRPPFYSSDPHGGPLPSPLPDGPGWLDYAPHGGTFRTANNRSSPFVLHTAADLTYEGFDLGGCGGNAASCGLSLVGGAAITSLNASADASTAETAATAAAAAAAAAAATAAARAAHDATRTGAAASRGAGDAVAPPVLTLLRKGRVNDTGAVWARQPLPLQACQPRACENGPPKLDPGPNLAAATAMAQALSPPLPSSRQGRLLTSRSLPTYRTASRRASSSASTRRAACAACTACTASAATRPTPRAVAAAAGSAATASASSHRARPTPPTRSVALAAGWGCGATAPALTASPPRWRCAWIRICCLLLTAYLLLAYYLLLTAYLLLAADCLQLRVDTHVGLHVAQPPPQLPVELRNWSAFTPLQSEPVSSK